MEIRRFLFRAASAHVLLISFLVGIGATLFLGLDQSLATAESTVRKTLFVSLFLQPAVTDDQARLLITGVKSRDSEIQSMTYLSKEDAIQEAQKNPTLAKALILLKQNPLPSTLTITYSDRAWLERSAPTETLQNIPEIQEIRWDPAARSVFRSIYQWHQWFRRLAVVAAAFLFVWSFVGMYRFLVEQYSLPELAWPLLLGVMGGVLALAVWGWALSRMGSDALAYRPDSKSWWTLLGGAISGLACIGFGTGNSNED